MSNNLYQFKEEETELRDATQACYTDTYDSGSSETASLSSYQNKIKARESAKVTLSASQTLTFSIIILVFLYLYINNPPLGSIVIITVANVIFFYNNLMRNLITWGGFKFQPLTSDRVPNISDSCLPKYTIIIPLYKEANMVDQIVKNINRLDYPKDKLEVLLVLEIDDKETIDVARSKKLENHWQVILVPHSLPKTKAKACNYALYFASGDIVTIYDAEDRPQPSQLKQVASKFYFCSEEVVCIQARLNYYNRRENFITKMFSIEYALLFNFMLPCLDVLRLPIPLGGTSNHIKTKFLKEIGGWDSYNVTEDADLGFRIFKRGKLIKTINSYTLEESPIKLPQWLKQRTRWIKGHLQTALVHSRNPITTIKELGLLGFLSFTYFMYTSPLSLFLTPLALMLLVWIEVIGLIDIILPDFLNALCTFNLLTGVTTLAAKAALVSIRKNAHNSSIWLRFPLYFTLHILASVLAIYQLVMNPHYWEKTVHGISSFKSVCNVTKKK